MRIALIHHRVGLMDGVSLEMGKWKKVLEDMGHEVVFVAGNERADVVIDGMDVDFKMTRKCYSGELDEGWILEKKTEFIENLKFLKDFDLLVVNNIWSLALSIPLGLALEEIFKTYKIPSIGHHHDFWWERKFLKDPKSEFVRSVLMEHFPPDGIEHVVINSLAKEELKKRRGFDSIVVPNVFDFSKPLFEESDRTLMRRELEIGEGSIVFLQATRITRRKAIELSIDFVHEFEKSSKELIGERLYNGQIFDGNVYLVFSGMVESGDEGYWEKLKDLARYLGVRILEIHGRWDFFRTYALADAITYPTVLEGFGNQLLEALCAKKPILIFEYEVFKKDIKPLGFDLVSLGDEYSLEDGLVKVDESKMKRSVDEMIGILFDGGKYREIVEKNFEIAKENFDLDVLKKILKKLLENLGGGRDVALHV